MTERNPRLIYCSIPGFARRRPTRRACAAWEGIIDAATDNCTPRAGEPPPDWDCVTADLLGRAAGLELRRLPGRHRASSWR